jgi:hypothetical protein
MLRFSIRDLLWLTVVVGLAVGWWVHLAQREATYRRMLDRGFIGERDVQSIVTAAHQDPALMSEFKALSAEESKYATTALRERRLLRQKYNALLAKARRAAE